MKNIDIINSGYEQKPYNPNKLKAIIDEIPVYQHISKEDVVELKNASSIESKQSYTYKEALGDYYNKSTIINNLLENATAKLSHISTVGNILDALDSTLSEKKPISREIQDKLIDLIANNNYPIRLTNRIIMILGKAAQSKEELANIVNKLDFISQNEGSIQNPNILKLLEYCVKSIKRLELSELNKPKTRIISSSHILDIFPTTIHEINPLDKIESLLLEEISSWNQKNSQILELVSSNYLTQTILDINKASRNDSDILPQGLSINSWQPTNILEWSQEVLKKSEQKTCQLPEMIAVINRANYIDVGYEARPIQIISILALLNSKNHGRLAQIATGEGKSTITAMLAAIHALRGEYVDVITSSPILAKRDSEEKSNFFKMLGLVSADNTDKSGKDGPKACYKANVVYGDVSSYQFDLLKDEYKGYGSRVGRPFGICIVDEVDSMLIDEGGKIAKLSSPIFGMEYLESLLFGIWQQLKIIQSKYTYISSNNQLLWIDGEFSNEEGTVTLLGNTSENDVHLVDNAEIFTLKLLEDYISTLLNQQIVTIPNHLINFAYSQAKYWAKSALAALGMEENRNYIIFNDSDGEKAIAPVAYDSTGVTQENTHWGDGLHQFLQIKHGVKIKPEGLTNCFISNMSYFQRYGNKIYGMTGTLGSESSQKLLQTSYNVDYVFVPTYRPKNFQELPGIVENGTDDWIVAIIDNIIKEAENGRSCLVISETIADCMDIEEQLKIKNFPINKTIKYYRSDDNPSTLLKEDLAPEYIIVATNLAGRGTDIKTNQELENNGGLHVVLTFLPSNLRVEKQAMGRTSRQGNKGTGLIIINSDYERVKLQKAYRKYQGAQTIEQFKKWRDLAETKRIKDIETNQLPKLKLEDGLFNKFKQLAHHLNKDDKKHENYKLKQLEELWGLWFKNISHEKQYSLNFEDKTNLSFTEFSKSMTQLYNNDRIMSNPIYSTHQALRKIVQNFEYDQSIKLFTQATNLDDKFTFAAHYNLAFCFLEKTGRSNNPNPEGAQQAARYLITARNQITNYIIPAWQSMKIMLDPSYNSSCLSNQIHSKLDLLQSYINYIDGALAVIETADTGKIVRIKNQTLLESLYPPGTSPKEEILELGRAGVGRFYQLEAVKPIPPPKDWTTNFAIAFLGVAQIIVGVAFSFATAGLGAKLSATMIAEGIKDIYMSVKATINKECLDFKDYWAEKGMSYAIAMISVGVDSMKTTANNARQGLTEGAKQGIKTGGKEVLKQTLSEKLTEVGKQAVFTIIKEEGSLALARSISSALNKFRGAVKKDAIKEVQQTLEQPHITKALTIILAVDRFCGDNHHQSMLLKRIEEDLKPHENQLYNLSKRLVSSISHHNTTLKVVSTVMEVGGYAEAIIEFKEILDKFCNNLAQSIMEIYNGLPATHELLGMKLQLTKNVAKEIVLRLQNSGIMTEERSFNGQLLGPSFVYGIGNDNVPSQGSMHNSDYLRVLNQHFKEVSENTIISSNNNSKTITPFKFEDLKDSNNLKPTGAIEEIDFGFSYSGYRKQIAITWVRQLHDAYTADYSQQREQLAINLGQSVSSNMIRKLQTGLIAPASSLVVNSGVNKISELLTQHNQQVRSKLLLQGGRVLVFDGNGISGISAGDDDVIRQGQSGRKDPVKEEEIFDMPWLREEQSGFVELQKSELIAPPGMKLNPVKTDKGKEEVWVEDEAPKFSVASEITIGKVGDSGKKDQLMPIYNSKNNSITKFSFINEAKASSLVMSGIGTQLIDLSLLPEVVLLNGLRGVGGSLVSGISAPVIVSGVVGGGLAYGLHQGAKFESKHLLLNEDFDSWMTNPLIPEKVKHNIWNKATNDPLLSNNNQLRNSIINISPKYFMNQGLDVNNFSPITTPNEIDTRILSTPIPGFISPHFVTEDDREKFGKMSVVPGFTPVGLEWTEQFPGFDIVTSGPSIFSTPFPEVRWEDLVLFKEGYKTKDFQKDDDVGIKRFKIRVSLQGGNPKLVDPKTGQYIQKDRALNSGSGAHDGEYKLFDRFGTRIGTITKDGRWLRN